MGASGCRFCGQASSDGDEVYSGGKADSACFAPDAFPDPTGGSQRHELAATEVGEQGTDHLGQATEDDAPRARQESGIGEAEDGARAGGAEDGGAEGTEAEVEARRLLSELRVLDAAFRLEQEDKLEVAGV